MGHLAAFSFYANKIITTGEGGMCVTNDNNLADRLRSLRNLCFLPGKRFEHHELGYNFRMTNLQAALGVGQMETVDELVRRKIWQGQKYREKLSNIEGIRLQAIREWADPVYWVNGIVVDNDITMDAVELVDRLGQRGIQTRPFFLPMHKQPIFQKMGLFQGEHYPVSESLARKGLYLPSGMALNESEIENVYVAVKETLAEVSR
jgi:perosamine synthetase